MKQIILFMMMLALPIGITAQVDDLYYVPTKKKAKKETKSAIGEARPAIVEPATATSGTQVTRITTNGSDNRIVNGRNEDEYNRRTLPSEDYAYEADTTYTEETSTQSDYTYSTRIVRFHSPRRSTIVSSPLYWNVVYEAELDNWTIYDDGVYWDIYPEYSYTTYYSTPWYYHSWPINWHMGFSWGFYGWHHQPWYWTYNPWYWGYPCEWYSFGWGLHHHHHGLSGHGHGWFRPSHGGYRNASYTGRNSGGQRGSYVPRATGPARADRGVRATTPRTDRSSIAQTGRTGRSNSSQTGRTNRGSSTERVYNRPSSTRSNATRTGVTRERTQGKESGQQSKVNWVNGITRDRTRSGEAVKSGNQNRTGATGTTRSRGGNSYNNRGTYNNGGSYNSGSSSRSSGSSYSAEISTTLV